MTTITVKVTEEEKNFLEKIASLENISLSDYVRTRAIESAEEQMDYLLIFLRYLLLKLSMIQLIICPFVM